MTGWMTASHPAPGPAAPPVLASSSCEGDVELEADRLPGPLRQHPRADQPGARFLQRVMPPLPHAPCVFRAGRPGQSVRAPPRPRRRTAGSDPRSSRPAPSKVVSSRTLRSSNPSSSSVGLGVLTAHVLGDERQIGQPRPVRRGRQQLAVRAVAHPGGQPISPVRDLLAHDSDTLPSARAAATTGCPRRRRIHPTLAARRRAGRLSLPGQPHPRRAVPVPRQPAARHAERRQHPRVRRRLPRLRHRQRPQAISLQPLPHSAGSACARTSSAAESDRSAFAALSVPRRSQQTPNQQSPKGWCPSQRTASANGEVAEASGPPNRTWRSSRRIARSAGSNARSTNRTCRRRRSGRERTRRRTRKRRHASSAVC